MSKSRNPAPSVAFMRFLGPEGVQWFGSRRVGLRNRAIVLAHPKDVARRRGEDTIQVLTRGKGYIFNVDREDLLHIPPPISPREMRRILEQEWEPYEFTPAQIKRLQARGMPTHFVNPPLRRRFEEMSKAQAIAGGWAMSPREYRSYMARYLRQHVPRGTPFEEAQEAMRRGAEWYRRVKINLMNPPRKRPPKPGERVTIYSDELGEVKGRLAHIAGKGRERVYWITFRAPKPLLDPKRVAVIKQGQTVTLPFPPGEVAVPNPHVQPCPACGKRLFVGDSVTRIRCPKCNALLGVRR